MKIGYMLRSLRKPLFHNSIVRFSADGGGVSSVLIILPDQEEEYRIARHYFKSIQLEHPEIDFQFIIIPPDTADIKNSSNGIFILSRDDLDRWHLPKKEFVDRIYEKTYDAVINLCTGLNLMAEWIMHFSESPIRIGYKTQKLLNHYNLLIERKRKVSLEKTYIQIQRILGL